MMWFKHQSDARNSLKIRKVRRRYGADGYAVYWFCLEAIAYEVCAEDLTFTLKEDSETIGFELDIQERRVEEIMCYMIEIGLFEKNNDSIACKSLAERVDKSMTNSPKIRAWLGKNTSKKLDLKCDDDVMTCTDDVMTSPDNDNTCAELDKIRKEKIRKDKEYKDKKSPPAEAVDYSSLQMSDYELSELKRIRKANKGGRITQRVANELAKQFGMAVSMGYSYDELLTEWELRGWKSFKSEWIKPKSSGIGLSSLSKKSIENTKGDW